MKKIEIFDPAMCCSTGVCGPSVDPELIRVSIVVNNLKKNGIDITRYNLASEPAAFIENEAINQLLTEKGPDVLPVTMIDGEVVKEKAHFTTEEFANVSGIPAEKLSQKPRIRLGAKGEK